MLFLVKWTKKLPLSFSCTWSFTEIFSSIISYIRKSTKIKIKPILTPFPHKSRDLFSLRNLASCLCHLPKNPQLPYGSITSRYKIQWLITEKKWSLTINSSDFIGPSHCIKGKNLGVYVGGSDGGACIYHVFHGGRDIPVSPYITEIGFSWKLS